MWIVKPSGCHGTDGHLTNIVVSLRIRIAASLVGSLVVSHFHIVVSLRIHVETELFHIVVISQSADPPLGALPFSPSLVSFAWTFVGPRNTCCCRALQYSIISYDIIYKYKIITTINQYMHISIYLSLSIYIYIYIYIYIHTYICIYIYIYI